MSTQEPDEGEIYWMMISMLHAGPCRRAAFDLLREATDHGLLPRPPPRAAGEVQPRYTFEELQSRQPCPPDHLRGLLRLVLQQQPAAAAASRSATGAPPKLSLLNVQAAPRARAQSQVPAPLPRLLSLRELGRGVRPCPAPKERLPPACAAQLMLGHERFGLRGLVEGHSTPAYCVAFDPVGGRVITGADDGLVKVWAVRTCLLTRTLKGHRQEITDLAVHANGRLLASASNDCTVRLWALCASTIPCVAVLEHDLNVGLAGLGGPLSAPAQPADVSPIVHISFRPPSSASQPPELLAVTQRGLCSVWHVHEPSAAGADKEVVVQGWVVHSVQVCRPPPFCSPWCTTPPPPPLLLATLPHTPKPHPRPRLRPPPHCAEPRLAPAHPVPRTPVSLILSYQAQPNEAPP